MPARDALAFSILAFVANAAAAHVRFRWILTPGNDIYFVSLNDWLDDGGRYRVLDRNTSTKIVLTKRF